MNLNSSAKSACTTPPAINFSTATASMLRWISRLMVAPSL